MWFHVTLSILTVILPSSNNALLKDYFVSNSWLQMKEMDTTLLYLLYVYIFHLYLYGPSR